MPVYLTDGEIAGHIQESKRLPRGWRARMELKDKRGHRERELRAEGADGEKYLVIMRQSKFNPLDFSVILALCPRGAGRMFRLRRYNGRHGEHTNPMEGNTFTGCHIHEATERYQEYGSREDTYAEPTERYADYHGAVQCLFKDCGFEIPESGQGDLFEEVRP